MNLELTLLELNDLYYAVSKHREKCETEYKEYGKNLSSITYFSAQLDRAKKLEKKVQSALYDEAKKLDEAIEYVAKYKAEQYDRERDILKNAIDEEVEPEYDSAGYTEDDRIVNGQYRVISNEDADEDARDYSAFKDYASTIKQDEQIHNDKKLFTLNENR